ncbi:MAG: nucleotidyltransferase domain-containing protein [Bacteroidales bacterium]|nr:nucleotidyltransferase domain-containing protein [Bacteroidales bacterium]
MELIKKHTGALTKLCKKYKVVKLYAFGSIVSGSLRPDSDIDLLVKFEDVDIFNYFDNYMDFKESLEQLLNREVDLVEEQTLKNPILLRSINKNKKIIYGRTDSKMAV